ncbi:MAG: tyrosine-type recombinase/integrase [Candidatus Udaeobacter sp.]
MRRPSFKVHEYKHSKTHRFYINLRAFGKGRKFFKTRSEADAEAMRQRTLMERHGREAVGFSKGELSEFIEAKQKLSAYGETLREAVEFRIDHLDRVRRHGITVAQLVDEMREAKRKDGRSEVYLRDLRYRLNKFAEDFGRRPIAGITVAELDNWLRALPYSPQSRTNYRTVIGLLFSYADSRGIIERNPISRTAKPKLVDSSPDIFSVDELRALLESANRVAPDVLPMLAVGAFAGLREAEIQRLDWRGEVDFARGHIEVKAAKAKSARRRIIPIQPNLAAWLQPYSGMTGRVVPAGARRKLARVREAAKLARWPNNGLRHSFASYRLAAIHDGPRVAAELGHTSPQMLYSVYRELVLPTEAERYWTILPKEETANVVAFSASA